MVKMSSDHSRLGEFGKTIDFVIQVLHRAESDGFHGSYLIAQTVSVDRCRHAIFESFISDGGVQAALVNDLGSRYLVPWHGLRDRSLRLLREEHQTRSDENCLACHGTAQMGGLQLDSREHLMKGGLYWRRCAAWGGYP